MFLTKSWCRRGDGRARRRDARVVTAAAVVLALTASAGCNSRGDVDLDPAAGPSARPTATSTQAGVAASEEDAILAAYREFFAAQTRISEAPAAERREMLEPLATDPALSRVLRGMLAADDADEVGYGKEVIDPQVTRVDGDEAEIADCQDTSGAGRKKRSSGKVITRGTPEADVEATMQRGADGTWRIATVEYKDDEC